MICDYGCGREALYTLKNGKQCCSKNIASCSAIREKISLKNKNKVKTEEWKKNISKSKKGKPAWNKGENSYLTSEIRSRMGKQNKGRIPWNKDKTNVYSEETLTSMRKAAKKRKGSKSSNWKGGYYTNNIPLYDIYITHLEYAEECKRNDNDDKVLDLRCTYCGMWFTPTIQQVYERIRALNGKQGGEQRLYCSHKCKICGKFFLV